MKKHLIILAGSLFVLTACKKETVPDTNSTLYEGRSYELNYGFLESDPYSNGEVYFLTLHLSSSNTPSPVVNGYSFYTAPHTIEVRLASGTPEIEPGTYNFSTSSYDPFHFTYLQYYFLDINQYGFAQKGTLDVQVDGSVYTFDLDIEASQFVGSNDTGETVAMQSHFEGTLETY